MNRNSESILSVYSDARAEYTKQLCVFLVPAYFQFFTDLLEKAKKDTTNEPKRALWQFQNYLNEIHDWNMEKVNAEINRINVNCGCDYLDDLLTAVFIAHTKILTAIRLSSNKKKVEISVPKVEHFLFKVLCEISKLLWSSTYLFRDGISGIEKQQNYRNIEQILNEGILQAIRSLVPVKSILKDFVNNESTDNTADADNDSDDEKTPDKSSADNTNKAVVPETLQPGIDIPEKLDISSATLEPTASTISATVSSAPTTSAPTMSASALPIIPVPATAIPSLSTHIIQQSTPPTIIIDDKPSVKFGEFDAVFDSDNPLKSEMIFDPKEEDDIVPALEILDEVGTPLSEGFDFDCLDTCQIGHNDYEELT